MAVTVALAKYQVCSTLRRVNDLDWIFLQSESEDVWEVEYQSYHGRSFPTIVTVSSTRTMVIVIQSYGVCVLHSQLQVSDFVGMRRAVD